MKELHSLGLRHSENNLLVLDQQMLPDKSIWLHAKSPTEMIDIIQKLKVRGAPLIGVAAALSLAKFAETTSDTALIRKTAQQLRDARPTAVNLMNAIDRMLENLGNLTKTAEMIFEEDVQLCEKMATNGAALIEDGDSILTHCNTGGLATAGIGTALGVIRKAHEQGKKIHVYVDETRPLLQGGRLTAWELTQLKIPHTLICDNMAATLMRDGKITRAFVGADRIAVNGDFANKIGTYNVAVICKHHGIPFYTVAPKTTVDLNCATGKDIPIEQRAAKEVRGAAGSFGDVTWAPLESPVFNPAFDVTPAELLTGIVLDTAVYSRSELASGALKGIYGKGK